MKKIRQIILSLACTALVFSLNAQKQYRLQAVNITPPKGTAYTAEFMMPPYTCLGKKNKRSVNYNPKFKYHRVLIKGLGTGYFANLKSLDNATYEWDNKAIPRERLDRSFEIKDTDKIDVEGDSSVIIYYDAKKFSNIVIELDYPKLFEGTATQDALTEKFENIHTDVIIKLSELENTAAINSWAKTTAAEINKKLNELLPEPHKAVTGRYGSKRRGAHSFIMVSPDMKLKVDAVEKIAEAGNKWSYRLTGTVDISILRSDAGLVVQSPFIKFSSGTMPTNYTNSTEDRSLQASTADIQLSGATKTSNYILLYQEQFKRNNSAPTAGPDPCFATADADIIQCNAFLVHTNKPVEVYPYLDGGDIEGQTAIVKSAFGTRNLILPYITIKVNGQDEELMLATTLAQFSQKHSLPRKFDLLRLYNGRYRSVKYKNANPNQSPLLLPGDIIIFKP
ncbi:MAG: hypothetical protein ACJ75B_08035 [Flavisolibacter sp.]